MIATTSLPPYYAEIFITLRTAGEDGYEKVAHRIDELTKAQPGYLGIESAREQVGITISY